MLELINALKETGEAHGRDLVPEFHQDPHSTSAFRLESSADTWISLLTAAHRNPQSQWRPNDIFDFDALSVAIPYCDVVVTDRHACRLANAARLPDRLGTKVIATLDGLVAALADLL